jgi:hypothetical protein
MEHGFLFFKKKFNNESHLNVVFFSIGFFNINFFVATWFSPPQGEKN